MAGALDSYNAKRDFKKTREPAGAVGAGGGRSFVVQKHDASRLHWDLRLEMDGVLKSWAVTRGPSPDPDDKRLAVRTEDHPLEYGTFEGTIPAGEYGGGTVMLWDRGTWAPVGGKDPAKTIREGHIHVVLTGTRMRGEWIMVRMKPRGRERGENWLLRKVADDAAGASGDLVDTALTSVATGRTMAQIAAGAKPKRKAKAKAKAKAMAGAMPRFRAPQLATLVDGVPAGAGWIHEVKYDGYRTLVAVGAGGVRAYTRSGLDWSERFAGVVDAVAALDLPACLIDGEMVALDGDGRPSFSALQAALKDGGDIQYFAFDLLSSDGEDLTGLGNVERKDRLAALLSGAAAPVHYAEHVAEAGAALFDRLCAEGYEGVVSKRADAPYRGTRSRSWLKVKCTRRQEFVVLGYSPSEKAGRRLKSLLLGVRDGDGYRYVGRVGTGFTAEVGDALIDRLDATARKTPPAEVPRAAARGVRWATPKLVAEVAFAEFTGDGAVRHASFLGLREDKAADAVVAERPVPVEAARPFGVTITHPDRAVFASGVTKGALADYYAALADPLLTWLGDRPASLVRCPAGRARKCFFQKHDAGNFGGKVGRVAIPGKDGAAEDYIVVNDSEGLLTCVQMGTIEFHGWGAPASDVEHPDRIVFDLDPDEGLDFAAVRGAAVQLRDLLAGMGLASFAMASGGKGVHVVVPLDGAADWGAVKDFADRFSRAVAAAHPGEFTANIRKAERRGRIFIDWLRNQRGATAVLPWSVRAREDAWVAAPVTWDELADLRDAHPYSVRDADVLVKRHRSRALRGWGVADQTLPDL